MENNEACERCFEAFQRSQEKVSDIQDRCCRLESQRSKLREQLEEQKRETEQAQELLGSQISISLKQSQESNRRQKESEALKQFHEKQLADAKAERKELRQIIQTQISKCAEDKMKNKRLETENDKIRVALKVEQSKCTEEQIKNKRLETENDKIRAALIVEVAKGRATIRASRALLAAQRSLCAVEEENKKSLKKAIKDLVAAKKTDRPNWSHSLKRGAIAAVGFMTAIGLVTAIFGR